VLVILVAGITALLWRTFVRVYSKAQISLRETLQQTPPAKPSAALTGLLEQAELETVTISPGSLASGKKIRDLRLRSETGASIVGLERAGAITVNPGAQEELKEGDQLLMLGRREELEKARAFLREETITSS